MKQKPLVFYKLLFPNHVNSGPYLFRGPSESFTIRTNEMSLIEQPKLVQWATQSPITRTTLGWSVFNGKRYRQTNSLEKHTVLSRIVAPSLIVSPLIFSTKKYVVICSKFIFCHLKQHTFINGTQNMQFYNVICCFLWYLPYLYPVYELKFSILVFLFLGPHQKLVWPPGSQFETIRYILFAL